MLRLREIKKQYTKNIKQLNLLESKLKAEQTANIEARNRLAFNAERINGELNASREFRENLQDLLWGTK